MDSGCDETNEVFLGRVKPENLQGYEIAQPIHLSRYASFITIRSKQIYTFQFGQRNETQWEEMGDFINNMTYCHITLGVLTDFTN